MNNKLPISVLLALGGLPAFAQFPPMSCNTTTAPPATVRAEGRAELVSDLLLTCTGGNPGTPFAVNVAVFLNTNITSNLTGPGPDETEAMLLVDEPQPAPTLNVSNGFTFTGQVKGTTAVAASGNVFTGLRTGSPNQVVFLGVPVVAPGSGTRRFRITNLRALPPAASTAPVPILAFLSVSGPAIFSISNPVQTVGFAMNGLAFSYTHVGANLQLVYTEQFSSAFKKRIENGAGPFLAVKQNLPGMPYCTESEFTPDFGTTAPGDPGSANTGTRLRAKITNIPATVWWVGVPAFVASSSGKLVAVVSGPMFVPVVGGTVTVEYEVTAAAPYTGVNACAVVDTFNITATPFGFLGTLANAIAAGSFAPVDTTPVISGPAPEPRFQ